MKTLRAICFTLLITSLSVLAVNVRAANEAPPRPLGPDRGWIAALAVSPNYAMDGIAWAAPFGGRIFATTDRARSWHEAHNGVTDPVVTGLSPSPNFAADHTVFATADDGIFRSTDGGDSWTSASGGLAHHFVRAVAPSPQFTVNRIAYAATDSGVYISVDGGVSWQQSSGLTDAVAALAVGRLAPTTPDTIFAGPSNGGLRLSSDGGTTWEDAGDFPAERSVLAIAVSPSFTVDETVLVGTDSGLYLTHNAGLHWVPVAAATGDRIAAVALSPYFRDDGYALAASAAGHGLLQTHDSGGSWTQIQSLGAPYVESLVIAATGSDRTTALAGTAGQGIFESADGGNTWLNANVGLHAARVAQLGGTAGALLEAGAGGASILRQGSGVWEQLTLPTTFVTTGDGAGSTLFIGSRDAGLLVSQNRGTTWKSADIPANTVSAVSVSPQFDRDGVVLAAAGYVFVSSDGGTTWSQATGMAGTDVQRFVFSPLFATDHTVYAATVAHGVYRSRDGGHSWVAANGGLPYEQFNDILPFQDASGAMTLLAASAGDGIYRSTDGGTNWYPMPEQPLDAIVTALLLDANGAIIAGTEKGAFRYLDGTWQRLGGDWEPYVTALSLDRGASDEEIVYVGTLGDGVWKLDLGASRVPPTGATASPAPTHEPAPTPIASSTGTAPVATVTAVSTLPRKLHPKAGTIPSPPIAAQPALLWVRGPGRGTVRVTLRAGVWLRTFSRVLDPKGKAYFGFIPPKSDIVADIAVKAKRGNGSLRLTIKVRR